MSGISRAVSLSLGFVQVMNPGLIGGLVLPILGAFPDSILILVSGFGGTPEQVL
jgi:hypothetical protein